MRIKIVVICAALVAPIDHGHGAFFSAWQTATLYVPPGRPSSSILATLEPASVHAPSGREIFHVSLGHCTCCPAREREYRSLSKYQSTAATCSTAASKVQPGTREAAAAAKLGDGHPRGIERFPVERFLPDRASPGVGASGNRSA